MKTKSTRTLKPAALAAVLVGAGPALVADTARGSARDDHTSPARQSDTLGRDQSGWSGATTAGNATSGQGEIRAAADNNQHGRKAGDVLGTDVYGSDGQKLGDLRDLVVDTRTGKITHAVVASGGILGFGANLRPVPADAVTHGEDRLTLNIGETRWEQAPVFTRDQLLTLNQENRMQEIASFYGDQGAGTAGQSLQAENRDAPVQLALASDIRGKDVRQGDQKIGAIDDLIVHMESRSVSALFDAESRFVEADHDFVVPLARFQNFGHDEGLTTQLSANDFAGVSASASDNRAATGMAGTAGLGAGTGAGSNIYVHPESEPLVGMPGQHNTGRDDRANADARANQAPVEEIRRAVQAEAPQARDVRVMLEDNKVVLRGTVPSEDIKERIENRAENAARGWDVESELRVGTTTNR